MGAINSHPNKKISVLFFLPNMEPYRRYGALAVSASMRFFFDHETTFGGRLNPRHQPTYMLRLSSADKDSCSLLLQFTRPMRIVPVEQPHEVVLHSSFITLFLINFAGLPPTTVQGSTSLNTAARAPTTAPSPMVTPIPIKASAATHA